jgi:carbonic anhydrase/SulP family sulfate permease
MEHSLSRNRFRIPPVHLGDFTAGLVVFLVAVPLCLGVALASGTPLFSGLIAGVLGGLVVGAISGSHTSVSGPSPGQVALLAAQMAYLQSFEALLLAIFISGVIQVAMGLAKSGAIAVFVPNNVIQGLLAAIGVILILKQIPHLFGHDTDPEGEMSFIQPDRETTFSELFRIVGDINTGAAIIGLVSLVLLVIWDRSRTVKRSGIPAALVVIVFGIVASQLFNLFGGQLAIQANHMVQVPVAANLKEFFGFFRTADFSALSNPAVYFAGLTIALVASLETLLNIEAVDKIDPERRDSPPNQELIAQGIGNMLAGLLGGITITSVIVRSSLNINSGAKTRWAAIIHGVFLLVCIMFFPGLLNMIPLSCLAAILFMTGAKLASPKLFVRMYRDGTRQFLPFLVTALAIVLTDLLVGTIIGMFFSLGFILHDNLKRPLKLIHENHIGGEVLHVELAEQVSFLNKASLEKVLHALPKSSHVLLDASKTRYIDADILNLIRDFREQIAPLHEIQVSLHGFRDLYPLEDEILYVDYATRELQSQMTPAQVLEILMDGNNRFRSGNRLNRDLSRQMLATAQGQHPLAVVLSCIDSRSPAELLFDLGLGDIFSIRVAGNIVGAKILGSMEYGTAVAGAKLIMVLGHTRCGAVSAAVQFHGPDKSGAEVTGCQHLDFVLQRIDESIPAAGKYDESDPQATTAFVDQVIRHNVTQSVRQILSQSDTIRKLVSESRIAVVGAVYDVATGEIDLLPEACVGMNLPVDDKSGEDRPLLASTKVG